VVTAMGRLPAGADLDVVEGDLASPECGLARELADVSADASKQ